MPILSLAAELCPKNLEGTVYSLFMSTLNFGGVMSNLFGSCLMLFYGISKINYERIGALIVLERDISLGNYIDKAKKLYADLSSDLLIAIFYEGNPLHDGGVIIQGDRVTCAGAVFPTSSSPKLNRRLGTRHRAALGLAEETDAICIVVSEETGRVSIALKGEMLYNLTLDDVRMLLIDELKPKQDVEIDEDEEVVEEEIYEKDK